MATEKKKQLIPKKSLDKFTGDAKNALKWFAEKESKVRKKDRAIKFHSRPNIGQMYLFTYDPKLKETLPYYDRSPLVFPVNYYSNGFLGMNLHYLPPPLRIKFLEALMKFAVGKDDKSRLKISYSIMQSASRGKMFIPTIKRYLYNHARTQFARIPSSEWEETINLPLARFAKASAARVWSDSRGKI